MANPGREQNKKDVGGGTRGAEGSCKEMRRERWGGKRERLDKENANQDKIITWRALARGKKDESIKKP